MVYLKPRQMQRDLGTLGRIQRLSTFMIMIRMGQTNLESQEDGKIMIQTTLSQWIWCAT